MVNVERAKQLLGDPILSDEEVVTIRDEYRMLVEIIWEKFQADKSQLKNLQKNGINKRNPEQ